MYNGRSYYQEWGKPAQELKPGDIIHISPEVKHWHGAAKIAGLHIFQWKFLQLIQVMNG